MIEAEAVINKASETVTLHGTASIDAPTAKEVVTATTGIDKTAEIVMIRVADSVVTVTEAGRTAETEEMVVTKEITAGEGMTAIEEMTETAGMIVVKEMIATSVVVKTVETGAMEATNADVNLAETDVMTATAAAHAALIGEATAIPDQAAGTRTTIALPISTLNQVLRSSAHCFWKMRSRSRETSCRLSCRAS